jgi:hypothetical protein
VSAFADPRDGRRALLSLLADGEHLLELRCRLPTGKWTKRWARTAGDADEIAASMTRHADVYVGMLPRLGRDGDQACRYAAGRLLWSDLDSRRANANLDAFDPGPTMTMLSGGLDGDVPRRYGFWALAEPIEPEEARRHTRRLAHCLGADMASAEPARILRVPGSRSHKTGRVARVENFTGELHELDTITGDLEDPPASENRSTVEDSDGVHTFPRGTWHPAIVSLCGLLRNWGAGADVLEAAAVALATHQFEPDGTHVDWDHVRATARDIARRYAPDTAHVEAIHTDFIARWSAQP